MDAQHFVWIWKLLKLLQGGFSFCRGKAEVARLGPGWVQGTSVCGGIPAGHAGERTQLCAAAARFSTLHQQHINTPHHHHHHLPCSPSPAFTDLPEYQTPSCRPFGRVGEQHGDHRVTWERGGGKKKKKTNKKKEGGGPPSPPAEGRTVREGPGRRPAPGGGGYPESRGVIPGGSPAATYILSETSKRPSTIISGRKSSLNEEVMLGSGGAAAVWREDAAGLGGSHNCAGRRRGRHRCGGLPAAAASPGSCHISLPLLVFSANPLRNRLLRQLSVERQVLSGEAEPSPRCGSPLTPAPPAGPAAPGRGLAPPPGVGDAPPGAPRGGGSGLRLARGQRPAELWGRRRGREGGKSHPSPSARPAASAALPPARGSRFGSAPTALQGESLAPAELAAGHRRKTRGFDFYQRTRAVCTDPVLPSTAGRRSRRCRTGSTGNV